MKKKVLAVLGVFLVIAGVSVVLTHFQRERWEERVVVGRVVVVGSQRIEVQTHGGKALMAEVTRDTRIYDGPRQIPLTELPLNSSVMIAGTYTTPLRLNAKVIRVIEPLEQEKVQ